MKFKCLEVSQVVCEQCILITFHEVFSLRLMFRNVFPTTEEEVQSSYRGSASTPCTSSSYFKLLQITFGGCIIWRKCRATPQKRSKFEKISQLWCNDLTKESSNHKFEKTYSITPSTIICLERIVRKQKRGKHTNRHVHNAIILHVLPGTFLTRLFAQNVV